VKVPEDGDKTTIEIEDLEWARDKLSRDKAIGVDQMQDRWITEDIYWNGIKSKLLTTFKQWYHQGSIPQYIKTGRIVPLSKDKENGNYPEEGKVRTITILNAVTKLYELSLLSLIQDHIDDQNVIHPHQRGF